MLSENGGAWPPTCRPRGPHMISVPGNHQSHLDTTARQDRSRVFRAVHHAVFSTPFTTPCFPPRGQALPMQAVTLPVRKVVNTGGRQPWKTGGGRNPKPAGVPRLGTVVSDAEPAESEARTLLQTRTTWPRYCPRRCFPPSGRRNALQAVTAILHSCPRTSYEWTGAETCKQTAALPYPCSSGRGPCPRP